MLKHHLSTAWRNFARFKSTTIVNVVGLSLGLACFVGANGLLTYLTTSEKQLPNEDRIVSIWMRVTDTVAAIHGPLMPVSAQAFAPAVRKEIPNVTVAYIERPWMPVTVNGKEREFPVGIADPEYLTILDMPRFQSTAGNPLSVPRSAVIGEDAALQLFGTKDVLGKTIRLRNAMDVTVTAVFKNLKPYAHTNFASEMIMISRATVNALREAVTGNPFTDPPLGAQWVFTFSSESFALLPADGSLSARDLEARLQGIGERNGLEPAFHYQYKVFPLSQTRLAAMHLNMLNGNGAFTLASLIPILAFTVLLVACANYANLAFAQATLQAKEVGLRKIIGASRWQLIRQTILEALLQLSAAATIAALTLSIVGRVIEARMEIPMLDAIVAQPGFWVSTLAALLSIVFLIAIYPALTLARVRPAQALRAEQKLSGSGIGTRLLIGSQFIIVGALVVTLIVVAQQDAAAQQRVMRSLSDVVVTLGSSYRTGGAQFDTWRTELLRNPAIKAVSTTSHQPWSNSFPGMLALKRQHGGVINPNLAYVGYDYEKVVDLQFITGGPFERGGPAKDVVIVDESLAAGLGFTAPADAVGQVIAQGGRNERGPPLTIVGVVNDKSMRIIPVMDFVGTLYIPDTAASTTPIVRLDRNRVAEGIAAIEAAWKTLNPSVPVERTFVDETFASNYAVFKIIGNLLTAVASMALLVAVLGAFNFAVFFANRRAHEIGVRKTLGASVSRILMLLVKDFSKPVLIANLIGWPIAYFAASRYLMHFQDRVTLTIWPFVVGSLFTLLIVWIAVGARALRAARLNPATVLRHE